MEQDRGNDTEHSGNQQDNELRELKWRLGLRRGQRVQSRDFFKRLHDQDEQIEVEANHGADDVYPAPRPSEMFRVTREDGKCEERQRYDAQTDGRCETMKREKESSDGRRDRCDEEPFRPTIETLAAEHAEHTQLTQ